MPAYYPKKYTCYISGGATQADYCLPKMPGFGLSHKVLPLKLVGSIFHGHCAVFHVVLPHVTDDSKLNMHALARLWRFYRRCVRARDSHRTTRLSFVGSGVARPRIGARPVLLT